MRMGLGMGRLLHAVLLVIVLCLAYYVDAAADDMAPYSVLGVAKDATQGEIRKAFRKLSKKFHPDKNRGNALAEERFVEVAAAYEILGNTDKRNAFDTFGSQDDKDMGFDNYFEYQESGNENAKKDFYSGEEYVTNLASDIFDRRVHGKTLWVVQFYAPWCSHCLRSTKHFRRAAIALDGEAEFAAVNCDTQSPLCARFGIRSFPKFLVFNGGYKWHAEYDKGRLKKHPNGKEGLADDLSEFSRGKASIFGRSLVHMLDASKLRQIVLAQNATSLWVVMFVAGHDALKCPACNDAKPNLMTLSRDLAGLAEVGIADCKEQYTAAICADLNVPDDDNFPHYWAFRRHRTPGVEGERRSAATRGEHGELFDSSVLQPHEAMPLVVATIRMLLASELLREDAVALPVEDDEDGFEQEDSPPPPPPERPYQKPPPKPLSAVGFGRGGRGNMAVGGR